MSRIFGFTPQGLESINGVSAKAGPGEVVIAQGNTMQTVANPNFAAQPLAAPAINLNTDFKP